MRRAPLLLALLGAILLAGCGGDTDTVSVGTGTVPQSASLAPPDVAFYVSVNTDFDGDQWQNLQALLQKFPSGEKLGQEIQSALNEDDVDFENDVKPALGPEVAFMGWNLDADEPNFVVATKSPDPAQLRKLVEESDEPGVTAEIEGWTVAAERQADIARVQSASGSLADEEPFSDAVERAGEDPFVLAYLGGPELQQLVRRSAAEEDLPPSLTNSFSSFEALVFTVSAQNDGVRFGAAVNSDGAPEPSTYNPSLDEIVPAEPLLFVSAANLEELGTSALEEAEKEPAFKTQLTEAEKLLGLSLRSDILPLLGGEVALALYPASGQLPVTVDLVMEVDDEDEARRLADRLTGLAEVSGSGKATKVEVGDLDATELTLDGVSIYWAIWDGRLAITSSRQALEALDSDGQKLADDDAYKAALERADVPDEVVSLMYSSLEDAIPLVMGLAPATGAEADEVRENLEPLQTALVYGTADGDDVTASGFIGID